MAAVNRTATIQDLDAIPDDDRVYELVNGEISVAAARTWKHQLTVLAIARILRDWVQSRGLGVVQIAPIDVILDERNVVQPDVIFVRSVDLTNVQNGRLQGIPPLVVEVISPTSRGRDNVQKTQRYATGIAEYWLPIPRATRCNSFGCARRAMSLSNRKRMTALPRPRCLAWSSCRPRYGRGRATGAPDVPQSNVALAVFPRRERSRTIAGAIAGRSTSQR